MRELEALCEELDNIIATRHINAIFQPIADLKRQEVLGYEALSRGPSDSRLHSPATLFETAFRAGRLFELELLCREIAMRQFQQLSLPGKLFLNATPVSLSQPGHRSGCTVAMLRDAGLTPDRVVIELTEQHPLDDYEVMRQAMEHYRSMGFQIAIDDLGGGYAGLRMWSELQPDYVKVDKHFIQSIHEDVVKQEFVRSIIDIARGLDCSIIAEGIETQEEFRTICSMGITIGQGYYFARPHPLPPTRLPPSRFACGGSQRHGNGTIRLTEAVATLLREAPQVAPETQLERVVEAFSQAPGLLSIPVVDRHGTPMGVVRRYRILDLYATNYGRALHGKKAVTRFMDSEPVVVEKGMSVEEVSQMVTENMQLRIEEDFIITEQGRYAGVGRVVDLLRKITDLQVRNARYANPLTLLPGNVPIYEVLDRLLQRETPFAVAYCDLDNFKPFNDVYGYGKGDQVIQKVAEILSGVIDREHDFVGHVGGDDFILILTSSDWRERCAAVLRDFQAAVAGFYNERDRQQGGIWGKDRTGEAAFYPLLSLSIGVVTPLPGACNSHHEVAAMASEAKRQAKQQSGNSLFIDRRRTPTRPDDERTLAATGSS